MGLKSAWRTDLAIQLLAKLERGLQEGSSYGHRLIKGIKRYEIYDVKDDFQSFKLDLLVLNGGSTNNYNVDF